MDKPHVVNLQYCRNKRNKRNFQRSPGVESRARPKTLLKVAFIAFIATVLQIRYMWLMHIAEIATVQDFGAQCSEVVELLLFPQSGWTPCAEVVELSQ